MSDPCAAPTGIDAALAREFDYWCRQLDRPNSYTPFALTSVDVLNAHFVLADFFYSKGEGIGGVGPRDVHLLESAVSRQYVSLGATSKWTTSCEVAATLFFGIIRDHPFHDANKRTALLTVLYHMHRCERTFTVSQKDLEQLTLRTAERQLQVYPHWKRYAGKPDAEVKFLAHYFRESTRQVDKRHFTITFRELNTILGHFNARLEIQAGNRIDVLHTVTEQRGVFSLRPKTVERRVAQLVCHDWGAPVSPSALKEVRDVLQLTPEHGVDSQVFYHGVDPMHSLVLEYSALLERLAFK
jgi:death-on-curing family protein